MTPLELLALIAVFAIVRVAISIRPETTVVLAEGEVRRAPPIRTVVREYLDAFIVAGLVALFLITFVVRTFFIPSGSMEPTLQVHDVLLVNEFEYRFTKPHEGDIVVFPPPIISSNDFIKRTIGLPGDQVRVHAGSVYRNGVAMTEPYIMDKPNYELEVKNYGIYVDGTPLDPALSNVPPKSALERSGPHPRRLLFHVGRQPPELARLARLGLRAVRRHLRGRAAQGRESLVHRPRVPRCSGR